MPIAIPMGKWGARGAPGELLAEKFLKKKGYEILEKNFRCPLGEIDLIAKEAGDVVFVEVKSRKDTAFGFPEEQITWKKRRKLWRLAEFYLKRCPTECPARIDIVSVLLDGKGGFLSIRVIPNAVSQSG